MSHFSEEELIAFHMGDSQHDVAIHSHLEVCEACTAISDSIGETLRVFSADPVPPAEMEQSWQRVRGAMRVLPQPEKKRWRLWILPAMASVCVALIAVLVAVVHVRHDRQTRYAFNRPGPLTLEPVDEQNHLDAAERLLTTVNHTDGDLDTATREAAHDLALKNAVYVQHAQQRGDLAEAATLDSLGRVLTNIDHQPRNHESGLRVRVEMNTDGLLLDIRILRQNDQGQ